MAYEGLCLGGPFDGEWRSCDSTTMFAYERPEPVEMNWSSLEAVIDATVQSCVRQVHYVYQSGKVGGKEFNFWVCAGYLQNPREVGPRDVMEKLIENYRPVRKHFGLPAVTLDGKTHILHKV